MNKQKFIEEKVKEFEKEFITAVKENEDRGLPMLPQDFESFLRTAVDEAWEKGMTRGVEVTRMMLRPI